MKWEPVAAMIALMLVGVWLVWGHRHEVYGVRTRAGASVYEVRVGNARGVLERVGEGDGATYRVLLRDGWRSPEMGREALEQFFGPRVSEYAGRARENPILRLMNITSWSGFVWVALGLVGQGAFFGRMLVQWLASERQRASVVPPAFWWFSLAGGIALFAYFVWRQDIVGVLGQSTGVVIYARNLRLIHKQGRRASAA